jgi:hypothetical protein
MYTVWEGVGSTSVVVLATLGGLVGTGVGVRDGCGRC